jgi:SNF2 family DNA or RNA helicase
MWLWRSSFIRLAKWVIIGQDRPVTVYRLVTEGTVEEKIVQLHGEKRDLADSLLEGSDVSLKVDAEELMQLLRQNG